MTAILDEVWTAVGDPNRRRLLDLLLDTGESTPQRRHPLLARCSRAGRAGTVTTPSPRA